ncbi:MAG: exodeoxyribonuclease VII small subunit [Gemmatimonadota bacterium]|nr:MAG: exodeoxyribonuclease VII small subunit [Gemmatimonadota bacterium]
MTREKPSFRDELEQLEAIVRQLEDPDVDLDRALELFEEGVRRLKVARTLLEQSELTVKRVLQDADGTIRTDELER